MRRALCSQIYPVRLAFKSDWVSKKTYSRWSSRNRVSAQSTVSGAMSTQPLDKRSSVSGSWPSVTKERTFGTLSVRNVGGWDLTSEEEAASTKVVTTPACIADGGAPGPKM
jgi:hypothetical protein